MNGLVLCVCMHVSADDGQSAWCVCMRVSISSHMCVHGIRACMRVYAHVGGRVSSQPSSGYSYGIALHHVCWLQVSRLALPSGWLMRDAGDEYEYLGRAGREVTFMYSEHLVSRICFDHSIAPQLITIGR